MARKYLLALLLPALMAPIPGRASPGDDDVTPIPICTNMPADAVIAAVQRTDAVRICNAMSVLRGVRAKDIRTISKATVALSSAGYDGSFEAISKDLIRIVKLRGLSDKPDRWYANVDIIVRGYQASNGLLTPLDAIGFLAAAGESGKALSDDGFMKMLILVKIRKEDSQSN